MEEKILEKIKISPKVLRKDFDITLFKNIEYPLRSFAGHRQIAEKLADKDSFLITVIIETLEWEYCRRKKYTKQTKVAILPKYTELLYQYFFEEYGEEQGNSLYAEWLRKYHSLCLPVYDIGSNYFLSHTERSKILKGTNFLRWTSFSKVEEIAVISRV